jgi:hypothetical protein
VFGRFLQFYVVGKLNRFKKEFDEVKVYRNLIDEVKVMKRGKNKQPQDLKKLNKHYGLLKKKSDT